ncbi:MAG TPA: hypothetical protein VNT56_02575 [Acidimicrobiales bacterium]|nr:hypothetical protein [Acidimicrobiales bacterium]
MVAVLTMPAGADHRSGFALNIHTHSTEFGTPSGRPPMFPTTPLEIPVTEGAQASYSAIACTSPAPFNDRSLTFVPGYPGDTYPESTRSFVEFDFVELLGDPAQGQLGGRVEGTITTIKCDSGDQIFIEFEGLFDAREANRLVLRQGSFEIVGGTGEFADLSGQGRITGELVCLPRVLINNNASSCADLGAYSDAVLELRGTFHDPTMGNSSPVALAA